jgi:hypothetical protein
MAGFEVEGGMAEQRLTFFAAAPHPKIDSGQVNDPAERRPLSPRVPVERAGILGLPGTVDNT